MIRNKRTLQITISITLSAIVLALSIVSGVQAIAVFRSTLEKKMAEDSEIIGENLRILIKQVTSEITDQGQAMARIQEILEILEQKNWIEFACVLDSTGRILAHPKREYIDMQVPQEDYKRTDLQNLRGHYCRAMAAPDDDLFLCKSIRGPSGEENRPSHTGNGADWPGICCPHRGRFLDFHGQNCGSLREPDRQV